MSPIFLDFLILEFDLVLARKAKKISPMEKDYQDLLVYFLWEAGSLSNREIGDYFGLTYPAVIRRVKIVTDSLLIDGVLRKKDKD